MLDEQNVELRKILSAIEEQRIRNVRKRTLTSKEMGVSAEKNLQ